MTNTTAFTWAAVIGILAALAVLIWEVTRGGGLDE